MVLERGDQLIKIHHIHYHSSLMHLTFISWAENFWNFVLQKDSTKVDKASAGVPRARARRRF